MNRRFIFVLLVLCLLMAVPAGYAAEEDMVPIAGEPRVFSFEKGMADGFGYAHGWTNGGVFNVTWWKDQVIKEDGYIRLVLDRDAHPRGNIPYASAEVRSHKFYGYGRYEVSMKAARAKGVVSSFFTYTGPSDNNPWDEIDFEFLGKDTTRVQLNYFCNGVGNHEYMHDLGFDAAEDFHRYAFEWRPDRIDWFVDGERVHTAYDSIPSTPGKIMVNLWCSTGADHWTGPFDPSVLPLSACYEWISFTPLEAAQP